MDSSWRFTLFTVLTVLITVLFFHWVKPAGLVGDNSASCQGETLAEEDVRAYFPAWPGAVYQYAGLGMEYADFTRRITHVQGGFLQMEDLSGTNLAQVVEYGQERITIIGKQEEFYEKKNLIPDALAQEPALNLVLLQAPLQTGAFWQDDLFHRQISATGQTVTVPLGTFYDVIVVKVRSEHSVSYEYYAKNMGLIKRETILAGDPGGCVISCLSQITVTPQLH